MNKRAYRWYVVNVQNICIDSGWENLPDATDRATALKEETSPGAVKVMTKPRVGTQTLDPNDDASWTARRQSNPAADVDTRARDERLWKEAKAIARREGHAGDFAYVQAIFQKMRGGNTLPTPKLNPAMKAKTPREAILKSNVLDVRFHNGSHFRFSDVKSVEDANRLLNDLCQEQEGVGCILSWRHTWRDGPGSLTTNVELNSRPQENPSEWKEGDEAFVERADGDWKKVRVGSVRPAKTSALDGKVSVEVIVVDDKGRHFGVYESALRRAIPNPGELLVVNGSDDLDSARAEKTYRMWHKKEPNHVEVRRPNVDGNDLMICVGRAHNIVYRSGKWEAGRKTNDYIHHFDSKPKVWMLARLAGDEGHGATKTVDALLKRTHNADGQVAVAELANPISFGLDDGTDDGSDIVIHSGSKVYGAVDHKTVIIYDPKLKLVVIQGGQMHFDERGIVK